MRGSHLSHCNRPLCACVHCTLLFGSRGSCDLAPFHQVDLQHCSESRDVTPSCSEGYFPFTDKLRKSDSMEQKTVVEKAVLLTVLHPFYQKLGIKMPSTMLHVVLQMDSTVMQARKTFISHIIICFL